ncbi:MAG TPA: flagellar hook-associated protein FlgL [Terriglobales bacterium]|nr:flagellar hook-associated protein FlgL [Terriglobales bacterium]
MRVNPNPMPDIVAALERNQKQQNTSLLQLASGQRINAPSDDPGGAATVVQIHDRTAQTDSFLSSIGTITGQLQMADSTLSSVVTALTRAIALGVQGATGTLSDDNREALAEEVTGVRDQLVSLANVSYEGRYVFAGTAQVQPFAVDSSLGVRYDGNAGVNTISAGNGYQVQMNVPGDQIFAAPGNDVFQAMNGLIDSLRANTGIDTAVTAVRKAFDYVTGRRVFYGNAINQLQAQQTYLNGEKLQLSQEENTVAGADVVAVASELVNAQNARSAALAATGKMSQGSLFDYL